MFFQLFFLIFHTFGRSGSYPSVENSTFFYGSLNVVIEVQVHVPGPAPAACVHAAAGGPDAAAAARPPRHGHGLPGLREARARQVQRL